MNKKIEVAGLKIDAITKPELLKQIIERIKRREKTFVVTPYSEFLYAGIRNKQVLALLNSADFSIADGVGVLWANLFLSVPLTTKSFYGKVLQAWWQVVWTGASILLRPSLIYRDIPEKIVGADLIWDLAELANENNFSVFLLGSRGDVAERAGAKLKEKFPHLRVVGTSNKEISDPTIIDEINAVQPDMVLVTFNGIEQEQWISENLP
ncbi:MAG TPA: WecB/TagA/CpsF family glycosyltransferase, partial [Patescibacteria group bacterium]|nr:WecB/TagA/CpsF family glycosyltransferase [Patescibacteria group bacterium]